MANKGIFDFVFLSSNIRSMPTKEDAYAYNLTDANMGYISVFDGCGGLGSRKYASAKNHTGAYLAARAACTAVDAWYEGAKAPANAAGIRKTLTAKLESLREKTSDGRRELVGSMVKTFPTTMAMASVWKSEAGISGKFLWAGDSRGFILDANGLKQYTTDDLEDDADAFSNIESDAPLSNVIHAGGDFRINEKAFSVKAPSVILVASDGVFNYLPSPMHFEQLLLDTMLASDSVSAWEKAMEAKFNEISGDDATLVMTGCMIDGSYKKLKDLFRKRKAYLDAILKNQTDRAKLEQIWNTEYRASYEIKR